MLLACLAWPAYSVWPVIPDIIDDDTWAPFRVDAFCFEFSMKHFTPLNEFFTTFWRAGLIKVHSGFPVYNATGWPGLAGLLCLASHPWHHWWWYLSPISCGCILCPILNEAFHIWHVRIVWRFAPRFLVELEFSFSCLCPPSLMLAYYSIMSWNCFCRIILVWYYNWHCASVHRHMSFHAFPFSILWSP